MAQSYAGDLLPQDAWDLLEKDENAQLVDCRTSAEWSFVGGPDLSRLGKPVIQVSWQVYPNMQQNADFIDVLRDSGLKPEHPVLFICRSGGRSRMAAMALSTQGFNQCYNVAGGFEGDHDTAGHRGSRNGWKHDGLPWIQE